MFDACLTRVFVLQDLFEDLLQRKPKVEDVNREGGLFIREAKVSVPLPDLSSLPSTLIVHLSRTCCSAMIALHQQVSER